MRLCDAADAGQDMRHFSLDSDTSPSWTKLVSTACLTGTFSLHK